MKIQKNLDKCIENLLTIFKRYPHIFLTEEDAHNHLFHLLLSSFGTPQRTKDDKVSISLHSEVRWYGRDQDRNERSDLVLIDVADLRVDKYGKKPISSKSYAFNDFFAAIEIKLRRSKYSPTTQFWIPQLKKDVEKLKFLKHGVDNKHDPFLCLVVLDKRENIREVVENLSNNGSVKILYEHA